ncbi:ATP-binding protein [Rhodococcus sp. NPDC058505]|uniref:ATP-binding protein n=1 Tax=Rhodococcus sp. NPDC058505 TaxID=3346531 RepID=UPI00366A1CE0
MNEQAPPASRLWNLEGWGLRWKVTAVLAIPVTVAMVLGGLRVQEELSRAVRYSTAADQVSSIPDIVKLGTDFGLASAGFSVGALMPEDLVGLEGSIEQVRTAAENPELPEDLTDRLRASLGAIEGIQTEMEAKAPVRPDLPEQTSAIRADLTRIVDDIVSPIDDTGVMTAHRQLVDAWSAQRRMADQVTGALEMMTNPNASSTDFITASGAEIAMIDSLARSFPAAAPRLDALTEAVHTRLATVDAAQGGAWPLLELRQSMVESVGTYSDLVAESAEAITSTVAARADETRSSALRDAALVLATLLAALVLALLVSRSLVGPIRRLRYGALRVARKDLPEAIDRVKAGDTDAVKHFEPVPVHTTEEIGQLARAVDDIHAQALKLAGEQASLRLQIGDMFETLARRSKSLVDQQLGLIEALEFEEKDPKRLESLFRLDHLAARMRRNGDNLLILSGTQTRRGQSAPVQLGDVVRAAMSEVEEYQRVQVGSTPNGALGGGVATDIMHVLAELLDNALRASPPDTKVRIAFARAVDGGVLLEVTDQGIGIPAADLAVINERLASGGQVGPETARHMGLFVASRLSERHGLTVRLRHAMSEGREQGITASVHIPASLLMSPVEMELTGPQARVDTGSIPEVTVVESGQMPQLVTGSHPALSRRALPTPLTPDPYGEAPVAPAVVTPESPAPEPVAGEQSAPPTALTAQNGLPQRVPGSTPGLPQRTPGASGAPRPASAGAGIPPAPVPDLPPPAPAAPLAAPPEPDLPSRHRYRSNPVKTASFFQNRPNPGATQDVTSTGTPIFSGMVSDWLTDPTEPHGIGRDWTSAADEGWRAADRAAEAPIDGRTESGLPQRTPGRRLVPGHAESAAARSRLRDPEAVRENLSRHQMGIRAGRAAGTAERNSNGGDK